jgi:hypothetical protein
MFQYAAGRKAALDNNTVLKMDISNFEVEGGTKRHYQLKYFSIKENFATIDEIELLKKSNWKTTLGFESKTYLKESYSHSSFLRIPNNCYIEGRWFDLKYFESIRPILVKEFSLKNSLSPAAKKVLARIKATNSVALHIRKTDYLSPKFASIYQSLESPYYEQALKTLALKKKLLKAFVFTDDPNWVKKNLSHFSNAEIVSSGKIIDEEEFFLMSQCQNQIIANSTFSWWAAWLNSNKSKTVITPKSWFKKSEYEPTNLIPASWIRI